jgi:heme exporter protein B
MLGLRQFWAILHKDLLIDLRRRENLVAMFFFALLTLITFYFASGSLREPRFRLTARALAGLAAQGWASERVETLRPLLGRSFESQSAFLAALEAGGSAPLDAEARIALIAAAKSDAMQDLAPGFLWVSFLLAGVLGLDKSFGQERENGCMEGLLLSPVGRGVIYLGKVAGNGLFLAAILALLVPLYSLLFGLSLDIRWTALAAIAFGTVLGFSALGTLLGGLVASLRGKEVLLPLLLFPLVAPLLIAAVQLTGAVLDGEALVGQAPWLRLMAAFDAVYLIVALFLFEYVVEA